MARAAVDALKRTVQPKTLIKEIMKETVNRQYFVDSVASLLEFAELKELSLSRSLSSYEDIESITSINKEVLEVLRNYQQIACSVIAQKESSVIQSGSNLIVSSWKVGAQPHEETLSFTQEMTTQHVAVSDILNAANKF